MNHEFKVANHMIFLEDVVQFCWVNSRTIQFAPLNIYKESDLAELSAVAIFRLRDKQPPSISYEAAATLHIESTNESQKL